jgi:hypothetical protein
MKRALRPTLETELAEFTARSPRDRPFLLHSGTEQSRKSIPMKMKLSKKSGNARPKGSAPRVNSRIRKILATTDLSDESLARSVIRVLGPGAEKES